MRHRIKVAHLTEDMSIGGQEKIIAALAGSIDRSRFEAEVWCLVRGGAMADTVRRSGVRVRILGLAGYHNPLNVLRLARHLRRAGVDIVHTHGSFAGTFGRLAAILAGKRSVVAHVHTTEPGLRRRHIWVQRLLTPFVRAIVCVSHSVRDSVIAGIGLPAEKSSVIYNGVPMRATGERKRTGRSLEDGDCLAVSIGSLVENKGHHVLIDAFHRTASVHPKLKLQIVGDGPLRPELEARVVGLKLEDRIRFSGRLADVHPVLDQAEVFILPTLYREGLPLALLEAMQHSLPIVATCVGGIPEVVVHGHTGLLVPPGDSMALSAAITRLASDPHLREALGAAARERYAEQFQDGRMIAQVEALYASLCKAEPIAA